MPSKLPRSVLLALGLTAGCQQCGGTHIGPCLSIAPDNEVDPKPARDTAVAPCLSEEAPDDPPPAPPDLGVCLSPLPPEVMHPCLSIAPPDNLTPCLDIIVEPPEPPEPPVEPCLEYIQEPEPEPEPEPKPDKSGGTGSLESVRARVLARGVLPADVADLLRRS